jgi:orf22|nr:MAG TPA: protein of unknown function DUF859 [Caudoviricetes sp.]
MVRANFSGYWGPGMQLEVISAWNEPNNAGNFSRVNVQVFLITDGYTSLNGFYPKPLTVRVGDIVEVHQIDAGIGAGQRKALFAKDFTVPHDNDGRKTVAVAASFEIHIQGLGFASVGFDLKLKDIPRASKVDNSGSSGNSDSGADIVGTIGQPITFRINKASPEFRHYIHIYYGNWASNVTGERPADTSFTWTPPMELCSQTPNALSGVGTVWFLTYKDGKEVGRAAYSLKLKVPDSATPTISSISVTDTNTKVANLIGRPNTFLSVLSKLKVAVTGVTGSYGSEITKYNITIVDKPYSSYDKEGYIGEVNHVGRAKIRATVTDSRGRTSPPKELEVEFLDYFLPQISFSATRVGANADQIQVTRNTKIAPLTVNGSQKNTMKVSFRVAPFGTNNYTDDNGPASATFTTVSSLVNSTANLGSTYAADRSFVIIGKIEDKFASSEYRVEVATRSVVMSMDKTGVGIGKVRERGTLDVAGDVYASNIYANNIQQYPLTTPQGKLQDVRWSKKDYNTFTETGLYMVLGKKQGGVNGPDTQKHGMLEVFALNAREVFQRFMDDELNIWVRWRDWSWKWGEWKKFVLEDSPKLVATTEWLPAGVDGSYYKRVGDVLTVRYDFTGTGGNKDIAILPADVFKAPQSYMFVIAGWAIGGGDGNVHVQVNAGGSNIIALATHNGVGYRGQLTIML